MAYEQCVLGADGHCHRWSHTHPTPAPAGVSAAPTSRDRPIGPAGAPLYSEDRCDNGHVLDCCGGCKCEGTQQI